MYTIHCLCSQNLSLYLLYTPSDVQWTFIQSKAQSKCLINVLVSKVSLSPMYSIAFATLEDKECFFRTRMHVDYNWACE